MQAFKLNLPPYSKPSSSSSSSSSLEVTSLLFEPNSNSLALMHSDSSILLFTSVSLFTPLSSPPPQTLIPPFSTSSCFLRLHSISITHVLFVSAGPRSGQDSRVLLRFWVLHKKTQLFSKAQVKCNQRDLGFDEKLGGVIVSLSHGFSVKLYGSDNVFSLHSVSAQKIWVFAAKSLDGEEDCASLKLMKCAVIDCSIPICSISISLGYLILGENKGVRVFALRPLIKGGVKKQGRTREKNNNQNGKETSADISSNGSVKLRTVRLNQASSGGGVFFVAFKSPEIQNQNSKQVSLSLKAVSIQPLSKSSFLVLDSVGDMHVLSLYSSVPGSESSGQMRRFSHASKVQMLAVLPDISARMQTVWISDGIFSIHVMSIPQLEAPVNENEKRENEEEPMKISAMQAIFASEKIQDLIPISANAVLVLGQGNLFAYAIS